MEEKLKKYIKSVIREQISSLVESTNMKALYHFTSLYSFRLISKEDKLDAANYVRDYWGNNSHISLTRHRSNLEGFAKEEKRKNVRIQFNVDKLNASHGIFKIEPMEFYSPNRHGKFNHPNKSAKSYYQTNFFRGKEYHNQAEEGLQIKFKYHQQSIEGLHKYIDRVDILFDDYYKAIKDFRGWINVLSDYEEISKTVFAMFVPIYVYFDNKHFVLQDGKCVGLSDMINDLNTNYGNISNIHSQHMEDFINSLSEHRSMVVKEGSNDVNDIVGSVYSGRFDNQIDRALFSNNMQALERSIKKQKYYFKSYFGNTDEEITEFSRLFEERKKERYESYLRAIELMNAIVSGGYDDKINLGDYSVEKGFTGLQKHMLHGAIMHRLREIGSINFKLVKENGKQGEGRYTVYNLPSNDVAGYLNFFVKDKKRFMNGYGKYIDAAAEKDAFNGLNSATEEIVYITLLYVSGIYRNNGVAKMLMNKLIEDYEQYTIVLNAHSGAVKNKELKRMDDISNFDIQNTRGLLQPRLVKFYKSFGFVGGGRNKYDSFMVRNPDK